MTDMTSFRQLVLEAGPDGRSRFREEAVPLAEAKPGLMLSALQPVAGLLMRQSPPGYFMDFHVSGQPQWTFVLSGALEIGLQDGTSRVLRAGDHLYATDTLPPGAVFDPRVHGHTARTVGEGPVVAVLVRA